MNKAIFIALAPLLIVSCAYVAMPKCELPDATMCEYCNDPTLLPEKYTYAELLKYYESDRESLSKCRIKHIALMKTMDSCNRRIDKYNDLKGKLLE